MSKTFFNFEKEMKDLKLNIHKDFYTVAFVSPRNTGKSTNTITYWINHSLKTDEKIILCRTSAVEKDNLAKWIESKYQNVKIINDMMWLISYDTNDKKKKILKKDKLLGVLINMSSSESYKSSFENNPNVQNTNEDEIQLNKVVFSAIIYDEFNSIKNSYNSLYEDFINLLQTIIRNTTNFGVILLGNKDNQNNPFLSNWGIRFKKEIKEKVVISDDDTGFIYVEYPLMYFKGNGDNINSMVRKLASCNEELDRFFNRGGFRKETEANVINFRKWVLPNINKKLFTLSTRRHTYEVISFNDTFFERNNCYYFREILYSEKDTSIPAIAFDEADAINKRSEVLDLEDTSNLAEVFFEASQLNKLYFDSFLTMELITMELHKQLRYNIESIKKRK